MVALTIRPLPLENAGSLVGWLRIGRLSKIRSQQPNKCPADFRPRLLGNPR